MNKKWTRTLQTFFLFVLVLALSACGNQTTAPTDGAQQPNQQSETKPAEDKALKTTYPLTVKDSTGQEFTFEKAPERILSVSPAETETLFALGLGDKIVGVSDFDDYPQEATTKPKMGSIMKPNAEAIIAAKPDIVFSGISMKEEMVNKFRDLGIKTFKVEPKTYDDVIANIELYGLITDRQEEAKKITDDLKKTREDIVTAVKNVEPKKKAYIEFSPGWTVGKGEFMNELIETAGGINVASAAEGWVQINEEIIIKQNPDVIMFTMGFVDKDSQKTLDQMIRDRKAWSQITAVKNNAIIGIEQNLISRPGPRIGEGLKAVAKALYPEQIK
ncbi:ABC transporter substrate-binding protein [Brevibacillus daliensis]|uniref:ABC transporter substrate-binding protein n=1 Tax=Brevibacillus daliensis TaxID=2892995 RepID=UPI001E519210|nr:ABC transporter substrate-binding protein [Brevibacillus daliensis]